MKSTSNQDQKRNAFTSFLTVILQKKYCYYLLLTAIFFSTVIPAANAQNILDNAGLTVSSAAAYATRKLSTGYAGFAIRVRRASDNKEADIAFDGTGQVSGASIATMVIGGTTSAFSSFYSATNCFVSKWYDQSGNGRDATQTTLANQPICVTAGVPNTYNGKQAIYFDGATGVLSVPFNATVINAQGSFSALVNMPVLQQNFPALIAWSSSPVGPGFGPLDNAAAGKFGLYTTFGPFNITLGPVAANTNYVLNATWNGTAVTESRNKTVVSGTMGQAFTLNLATGLIGQDNPTSQFFNGTVPELIVFSTALTTPNRQALENNQTSNYLTPATGLSFDGVDDYVDGTNASLPQGNAARTIEARFKTSSSVTGTILNFGTMAFNQRFGVLVVSGKIYIVGESNDFATASPVVNDGLWHHVAASFDGTTLNVYVDGVLAGTTAITYNTTGTTYRIGQRIGGGELFTGTIDEVRVWNRALLQNEVQNNMTCELNPTGQTGLVALYHLNQGNVSADNTGVTTATDASTTASNGTLNNFALSGTISNWSAGNATGNCSAPATGLNFDGVNDNINCGNNASISSLGLTGFTLEAWINLSNVTVVNSILRKSGDYNLYANAGKLHVEVWPNGVGNTSWKLLDGTITLTNNTWTHVAATWDGTTLNLYVNGVLNNGAVLNNTVAGTENLFIGMSSIFSQPMAGSLDELRIWNRVLCQSEIQNNINCSLNPTGQTGLKALYHFDQGFLSSANSSVTTLTDLSGNNNNGTLTNFALTGATSNWATGNASGSCTAYAPASLAGTTGGAQVCQASTVQTPGTNYQDASCNLIANVNPSGASSVAGIVNSCVKIDATVQTRGAQPYVQRHYDITPAANAATATGTITLYYTQGEFNAYNLVRGTNPALPTGPADATGISKLLVAQYHGTGTAPGNYTGAGVVINPVDSKIIWNSIQSRWEVTFDVVGFSGFYVYTNASSFLLPINLISFSGSSNGSISQLQWQTSSETSARQFVIERSNAGNSFSSIGTVNATNTGNHSYSYPDAYRYNGFVYYRLKMIDIDGKFSYSNIIKLSSHAQSQLLLYPNPVQHSVTLQIGDKQLLGTVAKVADATGKTVQLFTISSTVQVINMNALPAGVYFIQTSNGDTQKLIKE